MQQVGLVVTQRGEFPLLTLTPRGESVMMGKASFQLVWPGTKKAKSASDDPLEIQEFGFDSQLYSRLRDLRDRIAKSDGVPAFRVFPNKTLEYLTRLRPMSLSAGMRVKGIGRAKAHQYLQKFIDEIKSFEK